MGLQDVGAHVWLGERSPEGFARIMAAACGKHPVDWVHLSSAEVPEHAIVMQGVEFDVHAPWERQREALVARFPAEAKAIDAFREAVLLTRADAVDWMFMRISGREASAAKGLLACLPQSVARHSSKHAAGALRFQQMAERTVDYVLEGLTDCEELKYLLTYAWSKDGLPPKLASFAAFALTAGQYADGIAYPRGGAGVIESSLARTLEEHGGRLFCNAKADRLLVNKDGRVVGVRLVDGVEIQCPKVISNAGAANTLDRLVPTEARRFIMKPLSVIRELQWSSYGILQVFLGFNASVAALGLPHTSYWFLPSNPDHSANTKQYILDTTFTAEFPYVILTFPTAKEHTKNELATAVVLAAAHYDWFKGMDDADVGTVAGDIVKRLCAKVFSKFTHLQSAVTFAKLVTPLAHEYHLGASRGAPLGLAHNPERFKQAWLAPKCKGLPGLYLSGQDVFTCGVVGASTGGFMAAASAFPDVEEKFKGVFVQQQHHNHNQQQHA